MANIQILAIKLAKRSFQICATVPGAAVHSPVLNENGVTDSRARFSKSLPPNGIDL